MSSLPRVLFSNPPWWVTQEPCVLSTRDKWFLRTGGVRAGSRWPYTYTGYSRPGWRIGSDYTPYPFFMGYAASYVAKATGCPVSLHDSIAARETYEAYYRFLLDGQFDLIVVETATPSWEHDKHLLRKIKSLLPHAAIAVTGPIATLGTKVLDEAPVDAVIKGEYEKGATAVVEGARGVLDFNLLSTEEMNAAPTPYYDDRIAHRYWDPNPRGQKAPQAQVWSSRGCPYKCIFCVWPSSMTGNDPDGSGKRSVRYYTADYMEGFLTDLVGRYKYRSVYFDDDTFNLGNRHTLAMCKVMERIGLPWSAMCRADTVHRDTWKAMKDSGCFGVKIGFESGNQFVVDKIVNKHLDLQEASEVVAHLKKLGMAVHGTFTYGLPGENRHQMMQTKQFIKQLGLTTYQESGCAEIEGSPLRTLTQIGPLGTYAGARVDSEYDRNCDGNVKFQQVSKELRESF